MNIKRINRRECSINLAGSQYAYKLTGTKTSCSRKHITGFGCVYDITSSNLNQRSSKISNSSIKMNKLGLN